MVTTKQIRIRLLDPDQRTGFILSGSAPYFHTYSTLTFKVTGSMLGLYIVKVYTQVPATSIKSFSANNQSKLPDYINEIH